MRKGVSWSITLIITLIIIIIFAGVFLMLFDSFLHAVAPAGEAEKNSFEELYQTIVRVRNEGPGFVGIYCDGTGDSFYLANNYYIQTDMWNPTRIELIKSTKSGEEFVTGGELTDFGDKYLCCEKTLDYGNCNTDCDKGERFILGKDRVVDGKMCVCTNNAGDIKVWEAQTESTCYWGSPSLW